MTPLLSNLHTLKATHTYLLREHREKKLFDVDHSFSLVFFWRGILAHYNTEAKPKSWKVDFFNNIYICTVLYQKVSS